MLKNYFKIALRNIRRQPVYSAINIAGLGVGMACCLLILTFVQSEYSVNSDFGNLDTLYRINSVWDGQEDDVRLISFSPLAQSLEDEFSGVATATRYTGIDADLRVGDTPFRSPVIIAGSSFFQLFDFNFIHGSRENALREPDTVVLTEAEAMKLFGRLDVVGEEIQFATWGGGANKPFFITGVIENPPYNSVTYFGKNENRVFIPFENVSDFFGDAAFDSDWSIYNTVTYAALQNDANARAIEQQLPALLDRNLPDALQGRVTLLLEPMRDVYLNDFNGGARRLTNLLFVLAVLIMGIACFNYINISTALAVSRAKEVGMRKVLGASHQQLIWQYLGESVLVCSLGMIIAIVLAKVGVAPFSGLVERAIDFELTSLYLWALAGVLVVLIGIIGGLYPAFYLAGAKPYKALKSLAGTGRKAHGIRRGLVVFQFTMAIALFISAVIVNQQATHIATQEVGFEKDQVLVVSSLPREWTPDGVQKLDVIKRAILDMPGVNHASVAWGPPGPRYTGVTWEVETATSSQPMAIPISQVDGDFLQVMDIDLVAGDFFDPLQSESEAAVVLNEAAVQALGFDQPVGEDIRVGNTSYHVIGVVADYHTAGLEQAIGPVALVDVQQVPLYREMLIRLPDQTLQGNTAVFLEALQETWTGIYPDVVFDYYFLDQQWHDLHQWIWRTKTISGIATLLAIFVACLGLFGVVSINVRHRTREIGVRKVIGAGIPALLKMLSLDFFKMILIAIMLAMPLAYFLMNNWLNRFANRVEMELLVFVGAGLMMIFIAGITMSIQSVRAALMNPVDALRQE
ncbi:MAG: ABC transporter permease [Rhodothermales bacterium]